MTTFFRTGCGLLLGVMLWGAAAPVAGAQQTRTLNIRDGTVYVDGRPLADDQLPDSLNLQGINAHYRFLDIQRPVIELNGRLFAVGEGLTPVTEEEVRKQRASVVLGGAWTRSQASGPRRNTTASRPDHGPYLSELQRSSRKLYERLLRERRMEQSARDLAHAIRLMPEGEERQARIDTLRAMLQDIFELKQENRRREIDRLEREIQELQRSLQKRRQMRERMIQYRLNELTGATAKQ